MSGVFPRSGEALVRMREEPYSEEAVLQALLERHPQLLVGDARDGEAAWVLVKREAAVQLGDGEPLRGMLDHLFLDAEGVPTLVEVKRSSDTRIRREVVGQLLDYAANASTAWSADVLKAWFAERCAARGVDPTEALLAAFPLVDDDEAYWRTVRTNLQADRLRIVFVADEIPSALRRIVEYLNRQMTSTEVIAIEVKQYVADGGTQQLVVPRVIGRTEEARATKGAATRPRWTRSSLLALLSEKGGAEHRLVAERLFAWADGRGDLAEWFGNGTRDGSWQVGSQNPYLWPFVLYTYGAVEIQFKNLGKRHPFDGRELREELRRRLNDIPGVSLPGDVLDRRPAIPLDALAGDALDLFTDTVDWAFEQAGLARDR